MKTDDSPSNDPVSLDNEHDRVRLGLQFTLGYIMLNAQTDVRGSFNVPPHGFERRLSCSQQL